jgi:AcrR family transcriptional regulator
MARTRSEQYEHIQRGILAKAAALYSAHGYMRSSIADLAEACQLSRGALYHYFESKEAILFAILDAHLREMIANIEAATVGAPPDPREQFRRVIAAIVRINAASPNEQRVLLNDLSFLGPGEQAALNRLGRQIVSIMAELLARLDQSGKMTPRTEKVYTMMLFGIINYTYTWYDPHGPVTPDEFADMAVNLFLEGFVSAANSGARRPRMRGAG